MIKLSDFLRSKGKPSVNYELIALKEYNRNQKKYLLDENIKALFKSKPMEE